MCEQLFVVLLMSGHQEKRRNELETILDNDASLDIVYVDDGGDGSMDVYDMHYAKGVMTIVYITVFLIGTPGNLWIIYKLIQARLVAAVCNKSVK
ncbi:hypothetical protein ANCDUO_01190 [Ancylostoma duodenale]|uniref:Uncharacterized protein n=1 Tax=Ancylostoma duodenale TaxID=51022 RepID=A0A0C2H3S4_9BILA|nr:hypothetical protein ANCDUO_01190 [Ancylostoma duodenale]